VELAHEVIEGLGGRADTEEERDLEEYEHQAGDPVNVSL
jgi:hypothetical protein